LRFLHFGFETWGGGGESPMTAGIVIAGVAIVGTVALGIAVPVPCRPEFPKPPGSPLVAIPLAAPTAAGTKTTSKVQVVP
jgi:hypothetical protein